MAAQATSKDYRKWKREIDLAGERDKDWHKRGKELWKQYRAEQKKKNSYNLLAANTDTLRPNLYNSIPKPDVRRRFRDVDPLGKAVSEVMERGLSYSVDGYCFDSSMRYSVLDALVPGRGVSRVRYVPSIRQVGIVPGQPEQETEKSHEAFEGNIEELEYEQATVEHVNWEDFRHGYGRTWDEVQWVAFGCQLRKQDVVKMFGQEVSDSLKYDEPKDGENNVKADQLEKSELYLTARFWEVWDKESEKVFFFQENHKAGLIYPLDNETGEPPIKFKNFFPNPEPIRMVEDSGSLNPVPPYDIYRQQADEVDLLSARINKLVNAMKVRGAYDSTMSELSQIMTGEDNDLIAVSQAAKWMQSGGLEKAIWWMPIEQAARVIKELYVAREEAKRAVYELSGISDIMRGDSNANETLGAQEIKSNFGSMRLKRMQKEVQRYARDIIRLMGEVIGEKFSIETLQKMTGLKFPDAQMKQQVQMQAQQMSSMGQPVPEQLQAVLMLPSWDEIKAVMMDDMSREYRVDVETDSTVQASIQRDMAGLKDVLTGMVEFINGMAPAVQAGAIPVEAVKSILGMVARRSQMGSEVEDALDKMQAPKGPQADPEAQKQIEAAHQQIQQGQQQLQAANEDISKREQALRDEMLKFKSEQEIAAIEQKAAQERAELALKEINGKAALEQQEALSKYELKLQAMIDKAEAAAIARQSASNSKEPQRKGARSSDGKSLAQEASEQAQELHSKTMEQLEKVLGVLSAPKRVVYENGRPVGVESILQ
jgi:hypothetical protein